VRLPKAEKMILTNDLTQKTKVFLSNKNFQNGIEMLNQVQHDKKNGTTIVVIPACGRQAELISGSLFWF